MTATRRIGAVLLGRLDSSRLPGKVLADVRGRPLLWYVRERVPESAFSCEPILATTNRGVDDALAEAGEALGLRVYRGDAENVAERLIEAARTADLDSVLRVNCDSPFLDRALIERGVEAFSGGSFDLVTNLRPRTYPYGVSLELFDVAALERCLRGSSDPADREHVTSALYAQQTGIRMHNLANPNAAPDSPMTRLRLTIDLPADLAAFTSFVAGHPAAWPHVHFEDAVQSGLFGTLETSAAR